MTWLFRRLTWTLPRDDLKGAFYRAKVAALSFFLLIWVPVVALSILLPRPVQDLALLASFPVTGAVFWLGLRPAVKDNPLSYAPPLDDTVRRSLLRWTGRYIVFAVGIGFALAELGVSR